ncbi:LOW QUALITY PROTEIN: inactive serine/threonine-protein kinase PLK5 isoform X5 [Canis lupus familiaris]|uniref:LOW QUALITY PROTEIN: inactive serine/threonine-protein kinase PLK5 n=1 Tax=Canis lupus dingo TaxID=286419 RepID=UPI0006B3C3DD|nr:LOW QUALITY PROTEIN: inactive serine/threonine-protein kinase PLK5 isoform X5 [Canis lupus familiaris]XP_035558953.1 LOW QUALITY PROTEIN: inactive serine/threonine-protein kinase PLK5 [Canis lupus dingo]XP_038423899.1 LOW QUALITY PROTEIN: inactive serine/threonine-protein kinase PLK5 isoform X4 [Canis lupus familiaris]|eukprot:XP_013977878.1 LOW QUALITY PROTEIN: inactive serine/threonine-protein kinase PLK5 [Canis lupus familiaris]
MEPGPRRPRTSRPPVSAFLRDPSSGRVYRRGKLIGKGAFSRCYKLMDMSTSAVFALKVVPRAGGAAGRLRPRGKVDREIALHSRLKHRNIVALHGHFADRENVYMVLEYCSRQSLAHVLEARQTLTEPEVRYYLRGLVSGLRYLHQRRIVHRDLKPSNFFLNKNMVVKIGDLGLAARVGPGGHCHRVLCGTPNFLAPEVISRNGHSCQSDLWALGCIMYTVLTGTPPFMVAPLSEMYQNIRDGRYPEPAHLSPNARRLIARLLAPNPVERPSLDHLLQDDFFTQGFTPDRLPARSCYSPPFFTVPQPLGRLFRKVGRLLLPQCRPLCPITASEASGPGEGGSDPDPMEWGSEATLLDTGAPHLEVPVHLLTHGTLRSDPAGPKGSQRQEVEVAIRNLRLCLDPGLPDPPDTPYPATQDPPGERWPILWAPKWVDYSSKYGFGYQLSDGGSGVASGWHAHGPAPPGGEGSRPSPPPAAPNLCLLRFLVSERALLLLFSDGTVQISGRGDRAHLVLSGGGGKELQLTVWEDGQPRTSYPRGALQSPGCAPQARPRLVHALHMLQSI